MDARNPCQPTITSVNREIESPEGGAVRDGVLYLADFNNGLVLLDVSDPGNPSVLTSVPTGTAKGIVLDQHRLWLANYFWGIKVFSLEQPLNPALVASLDTPGKAYEIAVDGNRALIADWHSLISGQLVLPERDVNPVLHP